MNRVCIASEADRMTVAAVLIKNKYTVRSGSQRRPGAKSYDYYLEFWVNSSKDVENKIYIDDEADQIAVATILIKNKYTVSSFSQNWKGIREYFYLEYQPNPVTGKKEQGDES